MFRLVERRWMYFAVSGIILIVGLVTLTYSTISTGEPLQLGIDFTGGTIFQLQFTESVGEQELRDLFNVMGYEQLIVQELNPLQTSAIEGQEEDYPDGSRWSVRTEEANTETISSTLGRLTTELKPLDQEATSTAEVSGQVGSEVTRAAFFATLAATVLILVFMRLAFRKVPNAFRYGACAIAAMIHDLLIMLTVMSILGLLFGWQADSLFLTAILTVLGFSVNDTIVIFDRIRERKRLGMRETFEQSVNISLNQTLSRTILTSLTVFMVIVALYLFGGEVINDFAFTMQLRKTA